MGNKLNRLAWIRWRYRAVAAFAAAAMLAGVAAAASSASSGTKPSSRASTASFARKSSSSQPLFTVNIASTPRGLAGARQVVASADHPPAKFPITTPITKRVPTGKKMVFIYCGTPQCNIFYTAEKAYAKILGWHVSEITTDGSPGSVKTGWDEAVAAHPNVVTASGFNSTVFAPELAKLKKAGAFVVNQGDTNPEPPSSGVDYNLVTSKNIALVGEMLASWVVSDSHGKANTLYVGFPSYAVLTPIANAFAEGYHRWCHGCQLSTINLPLSALGTTSVQTIVAYLRGHPSINNVAVSLDAAGAGLPAALKAAGLTNVKYAGAYGDSTNDEYVKEGLETATMDEIYYEGVAEEVDAAARHFAGVSLAPDKAVNWEYWLVTKNDVNKCDGGACPEVPGLFKTLKKLWGKG